MSLFKKLFGFSTIQKPKSLSGQVEHLANKLIIQRYRQLGMANNCPPSSKTSDQAILDIYNKVAIAFNQVAGIRGERIPAVNINSIVFKFIQVYEMTGETFFDEHLKYDIDKYKSEGLRPDYLQQEIRLV
ncbi:MAG: hypothetical protein IPN61_09095 [Bacteroidetes bacterium]|nr:hypothetical protein [Bacteroidota bacterium]